MAKLRASGGLSTQGACSKVNFAYAISQDKIKHAAISYLLMKLWSTRPQNNPEAIILFATNYFRPRSSSFGLTRPAIQGRLKVCQHRPCRVCQRWFWWLVLTAPQGSTPFSLQSISLLRMI